jgi:hypothetical protein
MLLRRFPILNKLPLTNLQAQGEAKEIIQVSRQSKSVTGSSFHLSLGRSRPPAGEKERAPPDWRARQEEQRPPNPPTFVALLL